MPYTLFPLYILFVSIFLHMRASSLANYNYLTVSCKVDSIGSIVFYSLGSPNGIHVGMVFLHIYYGREYWGD